MNLERSTLERKDRAELATIAETLGRKPTSRARKADIIDLILELTGVTPAGSSSAETVAEPAEGADESGPTAAAETDEGAARTGEGAAGDEGGDEGRGDSGGGSQPHEGDEADEDHEGSQQAQGQRQGRAEGGQGRGERGQGRGAQRSNGEGRTDQRGGDQRTDQADRQQADRQQADRQHGDRQHGDRQQGGGQQGGGQQGGGQQGGGQPGEGQQGQAGDGGEDGEAGNRRRRRRRGRDRQGGQEPEETTQFEGEPLQVEGLLDLRDEGYGFLRVNGFLPSRDDVYVSVKQCRQLSLRRGDRITGQARPAGRQEKNPALLHVEGVNGRAPEEARERPRFEDLTPLFPDERLRLSSSSKPLDMTARIIDMLCPIGKGQRGMIVSPPKAGKTTVMKTIAQAIEANNPEVVLLVLLLDERPEEVTDMRRAVSGEVIASTFDRPTDEHIAAAEFTIERAKRMVEYGQDVVIILDGITRLSRAYNLAAPGTGRIMSGGIDTAALYPPKRFFGAARNTEEGGSLTILATALVETGSKMDEVIFEEFKGTGNMELKLDRRMAERRLFPAIDVDASSTRHEELLLGRDELQQVWKLRRVLSGLAAEGRPGAGLELLVDRMKGFATNEQFLSEMAKAPSV